MTSARESMLWEIDMRRSMLLWGLLALLLPCACLESNMIIDDPRPAQPRIDSAQALVDALARAYLTRDSELFNSLLAHESTANAEFIFFLGAPTDLGETQWAYDEETRIHRRMFNPESAEPPLASDLWLQNLTITLTQQGAFTEQPLLYSANGGLDGKLDPERWRAMEARYTTYVYFDLTGSDYKVEGEAGFVVIQDLTKQPGEPQSFLLYQWDDAIRRPAKAGTHQSSAWSDLKSLYR